MFRQTTASPETGEGAPHRVYGASSKKVNETQMASPVEARTPIWDNRNNLSLTQCSESQTCMCFAIKIASAKSDDYAEYAEMID